MDGFVAGERERLFDRVDDPCFEPNAIIVSALAPPIRYRVGRRADT
jgi:hypothetical protein